MTRKIIEIVAAAIAAGLLMTSLAAWHTERNEQAQLTIALAAQQELISAANGREVEREQNLKSALSDIAKIKKRTDSPSQVLRELPKYLPLPQAIIVKGSSSAQNSAARLKAILSHSAAETEANVTASDGPASDLARNDTRQNPETPAIELPAQNLKPLFDFVQDCRACDATLRAAQGDVADDNAKLAALTKERDLAVTSVKGGGLWYRVRSHLRWLAAGAAIGFLAAYGRDSRPPENPSLTGR